MIHDKLIQKLGTNDDIVVHDMNNLLVVKMVTFIR